MPAVTVVVAKVQVEVPFEFVTMIWPIVPVAVKFVPVKSLRVEVTKGREFVMTPET